MTYELFAVIVHAGGASGGHYYTYAKLVGCQIQYVLGWVWDFEVSDEGWDILRLVVW